jgi:pyruvate dehydrogenase E2 component (dihydrolipoamide acetyltransferase)
MSGEFKMPSLGADMEHGILVEWMVKPGDVVKRGDIVAVVETDKGAIDVEIFEDGVIEELVVPVDTDVPVGTVLARLRTGEPGAAPVAGDKPSVTPPAPPPAPTPVAPTPQAAASRKKIAPRARKRASELGVDLNAIEGTGPDGSVTTEDVERAGTGARPSPATGMRDAIAAAMTRANREIPHYHLQHTIDLEPALSFLEEHNASLPIRERVLPIALFVRAVARGLAEYPALCGWFKDGRFQPSEGIDIGLAVSLRGGGLVNPAIAHADRGTVDELWARIRELTDRARKGGLRSSEFAGGAATITSLGDRGVDVVHGIISPPQVALIGFGTVSRRPWVVDDAVVPRRVVQVSLAADHRVTDGHLGARFLQRIAKSLAQPQEL